MTTDSKEMSLVTEQAEVVAIREEISFTSLWLGAAAMCWLIALDILYACMDIEGDRANRPHPLPDRFGI